MEYLASQKEKPPSLKLPLNQLSISKTRDGKSIRSNTRNKSHVINEKSKFAIKSHVK